MTKTTIIIDSTHPLSHNNQCFDPSIANTGPGYWINVQLASQARNRGYEIVTADVYLGMASPPGVSLCVTDMLTPNTNRILEKGAQPAVCLSMESPLIARRFYHEMVRYAGRFHHNFQFRGTKDRLRKSDTIFHPMYFPMDTNVPLPLKPWDTRRLLMLVSTNKRAIPQQFGNPRESARTIFRHLRSLYYQTVDPWMRLREIYIDRIEAIYHFAQRADFQLYGMNWDKPIPGFGEEYRQAARRAYAGPLDYAQKRSVMSNFKFALCFENCAFPGYVTEKIFDCLLVGCIPVYFGAPDICDFVPPETFIDFQRFKDYTELELFLDSISEAEANHYLQAGRDFLASQAYMRFHQNTFVSELMDVFEQMSGGTK